MKKSAIETSSLEMLELFEKVSAEAKKEKLATPPISRLVYYWTRKPLIAGRMAVLASTLENTKDVRRLLSINENTRAYKTIPDVGLYKEKLGMEPSEINVLDPFAGTGNLIFPSAELGLDVTCSDYNPLAHLIEKSTLSVPVDRPGLAREFEDAANHIIRETEEEVGNFYEPQKLVYFWSWCIKCTHCGQRTPLTNQMYLAKKKKIGLRFKPTHNKDFTVEIIRDISAEEGKSFTQKGGKAQCISCGNTISYKDMTEDIVKRKDREMVAIQIQKAGRSGRDYILPTIHDKKQYLNAVRYFKEIDSPDDNLIPRENILASHRKRNTLWIYGIEYWNDFFSERQLLILSIFVRKIHEFCNKSTNPHVDDLKLYLSFLTACLVNNYSYGSVWNTGRETPEHVLTMRRPSIVFNLVEINPFEKVRGSLKNNIKNIMGALDFSTHLGNKTTCKMESVTTPSNIKYDLIITDPPYGDDVQYGELSEFLYLWVYRILNDPILPSRVPLDEDFCESWGRFGDKKIASQFFEAGLKKSFVSMNGKLKNDGILVVFFAHSSVTAWNQLLGSIRDGQFRVVASYAIHTENTANPIASGKTSFMSSIVIVCRKITKESEEYIQDIIPRTEDDIKKMIRNIPNDKLLTLPFTDLLIMMYGKVLEACTRHTKLKSRSDEEYGFDKLLENSRSFIMRELMAKLTGQNMNIVGPRMAFYLLIKIFHDGQVVADDALKISQTYGTDLQDLEKDHVTAKISKGRRLCWLYETEMNYPPENVDMHNLHQQLCYIVYMAYCNKTDQVLKTISGSNFREENLKQIISLILKSFNMRRNKNQDLAPEENTEINLLETLADILQIKMEGRMESFFT